MYVTARRQPAEFNNFTNIETQIRATALTGNPDPHKDPAGWQLPQPFAEAILSFAPLLTPQFVGVFCNVPAP